MPAETIQTEAGLFSALGLHDIPTELREGLGEIEAAEQGGFEFGNSHWWELIARDDFVDEADAESLGCIDDAAGEEEIAAVPAASIGGVRPAQHRQATPFGWRTLKGVTYGNHFDSCVDSPAPGRHSRLAL